MKEVTSGSVELVWVGAALATDFVNTELIEGGRIRYTTGVYRGLDEVRERRTRAVEQGVADAFITAYLNGKRIPVSEARALMDRFGAEVLVDPALTTP